MTEAELKKYVPLEAFNWEDVKVVFLSMPAQENLLRAQYLHLQYKWLMSNEAKLND